MEKEAKGPKPPKKPLNEYAKYSAMALQMGVIIGGGTYGGYKLDQYLELKTPIFTLIFSLLSVTGAIYFVIRDFLKKK